MPPARPHRILLPLALVLAAPGVHAQTGFADLGEIDNMEWIAGQVAQALPILPRDATPAAAHSRAAA